MRLLNAPTLFFIAACLCDVAAAQSSAPAPVDAQPLQCGRLDQRENLKIRRVFWGSRLSQETFFEELRRLDTKLRAALANVDDETRRSYITRYGTSELSDCLQANLLSGDEAWRFDQCAKQKRTGPSSCEVGLLVTRRGVVIFKLVISKTYFD